MVSIGSDIIFKALSQSAIVVSSGFPPDSSHRFTPTKNGKHSGASQSSVTLVPLGSSSAYA